MNSIDIGLVFTLNWFLLITGGVVLLLLITYLLQRFFPPRSVKIEGEVESKKEEIVEEDLELIAGVSATIAALAQPQKSEHLIEVTQPPTSLWKISSILYSSRYGERE